MRCTKCGAENREGAGFCNGCGAPISSVCPACDVANKPGAKFCDACGRALDVVVHNPELEMSPMRDTGERRHLTVLFCDLVGSTKIAAHQDPEEWRELVAG